MVCRACRADLPGCPCIGGSCSQGLICTADICRAGPTCGDLRAKGECFANQACTEQPGVGGACVVDACEAGFVFDKDMGGCVPCEGCVTGRSCVASTAGIGDECAALYRSCEESTGFAACGGCADGADFVEGRCVPKVRCGDNVCTEGEYCDRLSKTCAALPCPAGSAKSVGATGSCGVCSTSCTGTGLTGRYWPFRTRTDKCVCETFEGFYLEASALKAELCDADGDGWVRREADDSAIREDTALLQNARCDIRRVDRVVLRDEYGVEQALDSCRNEGFVRTGDACSERFPLRLLETARNDGQGSMSSPQTPLYGSAGRSLRGEELNGLTKACVSDLGDFDDDGVEDLNQVQPRTFAGESSDTDRLRAFAYFVELYSARYLAPSTRPYGDLVISERSRCADFPLHFSGNDSRGVVGPGSSDPSYWRTCSRFRDPAYKDMPAQPGYDFAQWTCRAADGHCAGALPGPASPTLSYATVNPASTLMRDIGLCDLGGQPPKDALFRGFGHHTQFRCMKVTDTPQGPNEAPRAQFLAGGNWMFNACSARRCNADDPECKEARPALEGGTLDPYVDCTALTDGPQSNVVGFAMRRYLPYGSGAPYTTNTYRGGCVNEDAEWAAKLCPAPEFKTGFLDNSFGRYSCYGAGSNWLWAENVGSMRSTLIWAAAPGPVSSETPAWCY